MFLKKKMNNVLIHGPDGDECNTDAYEYLAENNNLNFIGQAMISGWSLMMLILL